MCDPWGGFLGNSNLRGSLLTRCSPLGKIHLVAELDGDFNLQGSL